MPSRHSFSLDSGGRKLVVGGIGLATNLQHPIVTVEAAILLPSELLILGGWWDGIQSLGAICLNLYASTQA